MLNKHREIDTQIITILPLSGGISLAAEASTTAPVDRACRKRGGTLSPATPTTGSQPEHTHLNLLVKAVPSVNKESA